MRNGAARLFPDLLLRVQFGSGHRVFDNWEARMSRQQRSNSWAMLPGRTVPKQEDGRARERSQDKPKMGCAGIGCQILTAADQFTASPQVKRAIEADFGSSRVNAHHRSITHVRPDTHGRGLQIHPSFILGQDNGWRCILGHINQFFSVTAWNSAMSRSRRDLYTFSVRW